MSRRAVSNTISLVAVAAVVATAAWVRSQREPTTTTTSGLPRLVDLGSTSCKECKALAPILDELRAEYKGRLSVEFIDVFKNPAAKEPYTIRLIPTQILFDKDGRELWRHEGFISKDDLKTLFAEKAGVE